MKTIMIPINKKYISTEYKQFDIPNQVAKYIQELEEQLENDIDRYEDTISYQLGFDKGKEYMQQKIDKAIEVLKEIEGCDAYIKEVLEILGDKESTTYKLTKDENGTTQINGEWYRVDKE